MPDQIAESEYVQMEYLSGFPICAPVDELMRLPRYDDSGFPVFTEGLDLASMYYGVMMISGNEGEGKTMFGTALAGRLKRIFPHRRVITDQHLKPEFGKYIYWDWNEEDFVKELEQVTKMARKGADWGNNGDNGTGSYLRGSILLLDELYQKMHNRRGQGTLPILLGDMIKQWRHYKILVIGIAPNWRELDQKLWLDRITHDVRCQLSEERPGYSDVVVFNKRMHKVTHAIQLEHAYWGQLFWTDNPITMRQPIKRKI